MPNIYVIVLAGGQGSRFWPISRVAKPKQFLTLTETGEVLIQATARRAHALTSKDKILVMANAQHKNLITEFVPGSKAIFEPIGRNTAASIGLAAVHIKRADPNAVLVVMPADHFVKDEAKLVAALKSAVELAAKQEQLVTIGIKPTFPHTGYGYIKRGARIEGDCYKVKRFYEKPSLERAKAYFESGDFFWNGGLFVWQSGVFLNALAEFMPELYSGLQKIDRVIGTSLEEQITREVFEGLESVSVAFGVLEHARNCAVVIAEPFGWDDVGSWDAWAAHFKTNAEGNLLEGDVLAIESKNCIVRGKDRLIALLGQEDLVVIDSGDALLICPRARVQDVKKIVTELTKRGREDLV